MTNYLAPKTSLRPKSRKDSKGYEPLVEEGSTRGLFPLSKPTADDMRKKGMVKKQLTTLKLHHVLLVGMTLLKLRQ